MRGSQLVGGNFNKNNAVFALDWDLVIIDEAHEGTKTELGQKVIGLLVKDGISKKLDLSGTAYNLFDKYTEEGSVYTWDYVMEQEAKRDWAEKHPGEKNPYERVRKDGLSDETDGEPEPQMGVCYGCKKAAGGHALPGVLCESAAHI